MITIHYRCPVCRSEGSTAIEAREKDADIVAYMNRCAALISVLHSMDAPQCHHDKVTIALPLCDEHDPDPWIGKQTTTRFDKPDLSFGDIV